MFMIKSDDQRQKTLKRIKGIEAQMQTAAQKFGAEKADLLAATLKRHLAELQEQVRLYDELKAEGVKPIRPEHLSEVGTYLVRARISSGLTQAELARKLGVSQPMVHKYEDWEYQGVGIDVLSKAAEALGVSLNLETFRQQGTRSFDPKRQAEAILYFGEQINNAYLGKTKLMKLLYYADYEWILSRGVSITGDTYVAMPYGPVPKHAQETLKRLEKAGEIQIKKDKRGAYDQERYFVLRKPNLSIFTAEEVNQLNSIARRFESWTAKQMSDLTHEDWPWKSAHLGEEIKFA